MSVFDLNQHAPSSQLDVDMPEALQVFDDETNEREFSSSSWAIATQTVDNKKPIEVEGNSNSN